MQLKNALQHLNFHHKDADGWITLAKKTDRGEFEQYHYREEEINKQLSAWIGEDVYFSQNTFYKPVRRIEHIRQLRALYVDIDYYLLNFDPDWTIGKMEQELFNQRVPVPNFIIHSGRGYVVVWLLEPAPIQVLPLWMAVERYLAEQFRAIGGDTKATDAARVFRLAGTVNSKSGSEVTVQYRHNYRYTLREIQDDFLPELPKPAKREKRGRPAKIVRLFNTFSLHTARLQDLIKLVELRNYDVMGCRETICFLYRYWSCCLLDDEQEALRQTLEMNSEFTEPLPEREVLRATQSAEKAWQAKNNTEAERIAKEKGYPGAGYNISNEKLIRWLDISDFEQRQLKTIIGRKEKQRRDTEATRKARRDAGAVPRGTYLSKAAERRSEARRMREEGFKIKEIAKDMNISEGAVKMLLQRSNLNK